jgi:hypothetical protein
MTVFDDIVTTRPAPVLLHDCSMSFFQEEHVFINEHHLASQSYAHVQAEVQEIHMV